MLPWTLVKKDEQIFSRSKDCLKTLEARMEVEKLCMICINKLTNIHIQRVSKRMTRFQIIISNNENVLQLQNRLQTIK